MSSIVREPKPIYFTRNKWLTNIAPSSDYIVNLGDALTRTTEIRLKSLFRKFGLDSGDNGEKEFANYLLGWPEMSEGEYEYIKEKRKHLNKWK